MATDSCEANALLAHVEYAYEAIVFVVEWLVFFRLLPLCGQGWQTGHPFTGRQSRAGFLGPPTVFRQRFGWEARSGATAS